MAILARLTGFISMLVKFFDTRLGQAILGGILWALGYAAKWIAGHG